MEGPIGRVTAVITAVAVVWLAPTVPMAAAVTAAPARPNRVTILTDPAPTVLPARPGSPTRSSDTDPQAPPVLRTSPSTGAAPAAPTTTTPSADPGVTPTTPTAPTSDPATAPTTPTTPTTPSSGPATTPTTPTTPATGPTTTPSTAAAPTTTSTTDPPPVAIDVPEEGASHDEPPPAPAPVPPPTSSPLLPPATVPDQAPPPPQLDPAEIAARRKVIAAHDGNFGEQARAHLEAEGSIRAERDDAGQAADDAEVRRIAAGAERADLRGRRRALTGEGRTAVDDLLAARSRFEQLVLSTYERSGTDSPTELAAVQGQDANEATVARTYAGAVGEETVDAARTYTALRDDVDAELVRLAERLATADLEVANARQAAEAAEARVEAADVALMELGPPPQQLLADAAGWRFPVAGSASFIDSWGFPRSGGRRHQGTDVFAAWGTPVVALERGVVSKISTNSLGGLVVWLQGESGNAYYHAHLAGYGAGLEVGQVVESGALLGYVGNTGNAITTPPHVHFEVHPGGGDAANPYPLLRALADADEIVAPPPVPYLPLTRPATGG